MDHIVVRPAQPGDGRDLARGYLQSCRYYAQLDPEAFQIPTTDGLTEWIEASLQRPRSLDTYIGSPFSVPFYEKRMGYRRQAVIFRKALR